MESPKVFEFAESPAPAAVEKLVSEMQMAGYDTVIFNLKNGDAYATLLSRFVKFEPESPILSMTFRKREPQ